MLSWQAISTMENFPSLDEKSRDINDGSLQKQCTQLRKATSVPGKRPALRTQAMQPPNPHCKHRAMQLHSLFSRSLGIHHPLAPEICAHLDKIQKRNLSNICIYSLSGFASRHNRISIKTGSQKLLNQVQHCMLVQCHIFDQPSCIQAGWACQHKAFQLL